MGLEGGDPPPKTLLAPLFCSFSFLIFLKQTGQFGAHLVSYWRPWSSGPPRFFSRSTPAFTSPISIHTWYPSIKLNCISTMMKLCFLLSFAFCLQFKEQTPAIEMWVPP